MNSTSARPPTPRTALMVTAGTAAEAIRAVAEGADLIDLTGASPAEAAEFRQARPGVPVCADDGAADLTRTPEFAAGRQARLICATPQEAARSGLPPDRLLIETDPAGLQAALATGYPVLVNLPDAPAAAHLPPPPGAGPPADAPPGADGPPGPEALALAALSGWLGAAVVTTRYPLPVRRALDLTDSVRGTRPPARTVRGLA
jgi:dihydropteroate synthase